MSFRSKDTQIDIHSARACLEELTDEELQQHISDNQPSDQVDDLRADQAIAAVESLIDIHERISANRTSSANDLALIHMSLESIEEATGMELLGLVPSMEDYNPHTELTISTESVIDTIATVIKSVAKWLISRFKNEADRFQSFWLFFERQQAKIDSLKRSSDFSGKNLVTKTRATKYLRHGNNLLVKDFPEYCKKFKEMKDTMVVFNSEISKFSRNDLMQSFKVFVSPLTGYDDKYVEMFYNLRDLIETITKAGSMHEVVAGKFYQDYDSPDMLGMSHIEARIPKRDKYRDGSVAQMARVHTYLCCELIRDKKFSFTEMLPGGSYVLEKVTERDVDNLLKNCEELIESYRPFMSILHKLSTHSGSAWVLTEAAVSVVTPLAWWKVLLKSYRLMVRSSAVLYACAMGAQNFSRGNVATALTLVENIRASR